MSSWREFAFSLRCALRVARRIPNARGGQNHAFPFRNEKRVFSYVLSHKCLHLKGYSIIWNKMSRRPASALLSASLSTAVISTGSLVQFTAIHWVPLCRSQCWLVLGARDSVVRSHPRTLSLWKLQAPGGYRQWAKVWWEKIPDTNSNACGKMETNQRLRFCYRAKQRLFTFHKVVQGGNTLEEGMLQSAQWLFNPAFVTP